MRKAATTLHSSGLVELVYVQRAICQVEVPTGSRCRIDSCYADYRAGLGSNITYYPTFIRRQCSGNSHPIAHYCSAIAAEKKLNYIIHGFPRAIDNSHYLATGRGIAILCRSCWLVGYQCDTQKSENGKEAERSSQKRLLFRRC
jgi:hypothetical protein